MEPFIGEVRLLPYTFAPRGWALCEGQLMPVSQNTALYSIIGTTYGGNGVSTFALPNLQGCVVPNAGQGPGLQAWDPGQRAGSDAVTLEVSEMPRHTHALNGLNEIGDTDVPAADAYLGQDKRRGQGVINFLAPAGTALDVTLSPEALSYSGGSQPHENRQPFISLNFCIALTGVFPQRK